MYQREKQTGGRLMTVGELARRTGMSAKAIRQFEELGLIYSAGRSEANYRLFDESAIWCIQVIGNLRSLGLTIKEIQQLDRIQRRIRDLRAANSTALAEIGRA